MQRASLFLLVLAPLIAGLDDHVRLIKTEAEFKDLAKTDNVLVKFYAPWCGHCKALAPEYVKASKQLREDKVENVKMAEVDCTEEKTKNLCTKYGVSGYPTIKYFSAKSKTPISYEGQRKSEGLVSFVKKVLRDAIVLVSGQKELDDLLKENSMVVIEYSKDSPSKRFSQVANNLRLTYSFAHIQSEELMKSHGMEPDGVALFRTFDDAKLVFGGKKRKLSEWIDHHSFPVLGEMDGDNYRKYFEKNIPIFWIAVDKKDAASMEKVRALAAAFKLLREKFFAIFIDGPTFKDALKSMGFSEDYPNAMLVNRDEKYRFEGELTAEKIAVFAEKFGKKELVRFFRSAAAPEKNDGPVLEVVGDTFAQLVLDEEHDVLLEFYLTYCQHCKKFSPEYEKLAELFEGESLLRLAKINGEENDTPEKVDNYPTLVLFRAGLKDQPLRYSGDMTAEKVEKWLLANAPLLRKEESKGESADKTDKKEL